MAPRHSARDQIVTNADPNSYFKDETRATYSPIGYLTQSALSQKAHNPIQNDTSSHVAGNTYSYDPLGNLRQLVTRDSTKLGSGSFIQTFTSTDTLHYQARTGRLLLRKTFSTTTPQDISYFYDDDGNTRQEIQAATTNNAYFVRGALYDALNRLVASLDRVGNGASPSIVQRTDSTAIRYDALGRRIWSRVHPWCEEGVSGAPDVRCILGAERRTVWDGDQVLGEIQGVHYFANDSWLEADDNWGLLWTNPGLPTQNFDLNSYYGSVLYTPGLAIDEPLSVFRYYYSDAVRPDTTGWRIWPAFSIYPFWNSTGVPVFGAFSDGAEFRPYHLGGGQTSCPPYNTVSDNRCVKTEWPFQYSPFDKSNGRVQRVSWHGALLEASHDQNGYEDKRNRYYDPATGRFAQEDPIGLAGGLNLYGFASGDPVNFSDPFGLFSCPPLCSESTEPGYSGSTNPGLFDPTAFIGKAELKLGAALLFGVVKGLGREAALEGGRLVIGKLESLEAKGALERGERSLLSRLSGDLGTPKANWARNAGALRAEMARGLPIRDASVNPLTGALENNTGFLRAERGLLQERGWAYNAKTHLWNPPSP